MKRSVLWIPVWFACVFILINYFIVTFGRALTPIAEEESREWQWWLASSLFLFPNLLLSFLLWSYKKTEKPSERELRILCWSAIICGLLPQVFIYVFYYSMWDATGALVPVVMFGFPFVYLMGMMVGWVVGLLFVRLYP